MLRLILRHTSTVIARVAVALACVHQRQPQPQQRGRLQSEPACVCQSSRSLPYMHTSRGAWEHVRKERDGREHATALTRAYMHTSRHSKNACKELQDTPAAAAVEAGQANVFAGDEGKRRRLQRRPAIMERGAEKGRGMEERKKQGKMIE